MSIRDLAEKIKSQGREALDRVKGDEIASKYYTAPVIVLVGLSSFGLGRLSIIEANREPIIIENSVEIEEKTVAPAAGATVLPVLTQSASVTSVAPGGKIVASRNGTKYYFPWCASNIAEKNKIWFNSEADARAKGYQPAANCKGLK